MADRPPSLKSRKQFALAAAARAIGGKRLAEAEVIVVPPQAAKPTAARLQLQPPRLRFDRVVLALWARLRAALRDVLPTGTTVIVSVTAPIRLPAKTANELEERIQALLKRRAAKLAGTVNGNGVRIRITKGGTASRLVGFVHNPDSNPDILFDLTQLLLERVKGERPLIIALEDDPAWTDTYGRVCEQFFAAGAVVVVVGSDGEALVPEGTA